jgi:hypothetical protein
LDTQGQTLLLTLYVAIDLSFWCRPDAYHVGFPQRAMHWYVPDTPLVLLAHFGYLHNLNKTMTKHNDILMKQNETEKK